MSPPVPDITLLLLLLVCPFPLFLSHSVVATFCCFAAPPQLSQEFGSLFNNVAAAVASPPPPPHPPQCLARITLKKDRVQPVLVHYRESQATKRSAAALCNVQWSGVDRGIDNWVVLVPTVCCCCDYCLLLLQRGQRQCKVRVAIAAS